MPRFTSEESVITFPNLQSVSFRSLLWESVHAAGHRPTSLLSPASRLRYDSILADEFERLGTILEMFPALREVWLHLRHLAPDEHEDFKFHPLVPALFPCADTLTKLVLTRSCYGKGNGFPEANVDFSILTGLRHLWCSFIFLTPLSPCGHSIRTTLSSPPYAYASSTILALESSTSCLPISNPKKESSRGTDLKNSYLKSRPFSLTCLLSRVTKPTVRYMPCCA